MDDQQRQPRDGDRNPVRDRIKRAVADGRISAADGDIRLTNVSSAQSMAELGLIVRDLDQLDAALGTGPVAAPSPTPIPTTTPTSVVDTAVTAAGDGVRRTLPLLVGMLVLGLVVAGVVGFFVLSGGGSTGSAGSDEPRELPSALPVTTSPSVAPGQVDPGDPADPEDPVPPDEPAGAAFTLTADGVRDFLATYRAKFGTTKVTDLTMFGDYVVMQVPVPGKNRHAGWIYRDGTFSDFGGVQANFPGTEVVDLRRLDVPALMKNIGRAKRTLNVEDQNQTYVTINYRPQFDDGVNVNIYVSNEFHESGYLATHLDGSFERAYPYAS